MVVIFVDALCDVANYFFSLIILVRIILGNILRKEIYHVVNSTMCYI